MASYVRCLFLFFIVAISVLSLHTHARESKFFSKVTKTKQQSSPDDSISISPAISPSLAPSPSPEPEVVEHGYGLYGRDPYEFTPTTTHPTNSPILGEEKYVPVDELSNNKLYGNENGNDYHYSPTTSNPTKTPVVGEEKYVPVDESSNNEFYGNGNEYQYPPTTSNPTKTPVFGEEKYAPNEVFVKSNNNGNGNGKGVSGLRALDNERFRFKNEGNGNGYVSEKQGMSDTRYLENGKYYYDIEAEKDAKMEQTAQFNGNSFENERFQEGINGNEYGTEKQGISDTRFLENGKYYYDIEAEKDAKKEQTADRFNGNSFENERFEEDKQGINGNGNEYGAEKQGMRDTRFLDTGKYWYDVSNEKDAIKEQTPQFNANSFGNEEFEDEQGMDKYGQSEGNGYETQKQGMSDTRFLENGKYFYDVKNENLNSNNNKNDNNGYGNEEERNEGRNEFVAGERGGYNYNGNTKKLPNYGSTKKLPNTYDTMEEYDREQGYVDPKDAYVP